MTLPARRDLIRRDLLNHRMPWRGRGSLTFEQLEPRTLLSNWSGWLPPGTTVWESDEVQIVTGWVGVPEGSTLQIEPGTVIKFSDRASLYVDGALDAVGTPDEPITLTSVLDDGIGGDTKGDADAVGKRQKRKVAAYQDLRKIIDDKSIDVVSIATCNHWHALAPVRSGQRTIRRQRGGRLHAAPY